MEQATPITRFSLPPVTGPYEAWNGKSRLHCDGAPTATYIDGCDLKAQFAVGAHYLLVAEHDCPYEETVAVTLLAKNLRRISHFTTPGMYTSLFYSHLIWQGASAFELHFKNTKDYYRCRIRSFSIPFLLPHLSKRLVRQAS